MIREIETKAVNGFLAISVILAALAGTAFGLVSTAQATDRPPLFIALAVAAVLLFCLAGFFVVNPGQSRVLVLFGTYKGSVKSPGWHWANPFLVKRTLSLRIRNFETTKLKVNDSHSNPIEIGAIVVWKVVETAEALFEVDDFEKYVTVQSESALRAVATSYPYDSHGKGEALSTHTAEVSAALRTAVQERLAMAGIEVIETRISHLAYATEIAQAMLQRQQASAIVAARFIIVEGAVGMVENALELLSSKGIVTLDEERKAQMVSNLLVVLCSERSTQPVVNAGSLYT